jgi:iron(III) transport system substrate-binding protein
MNTDKPWILNLCSSVFICGSILLSGCDAEPARQVVLYTSVDQPIVSASVREFEEQTGIKVVLVSDTEATKSVGLAERLRAERSRPQADVWWGNEPFHTINLAEEGVLAPYNSQVASGIAERFRDAENRWTGCGFRMRVIAVHGDREEVRIGLDDFAKSKRAALARPTAGTTGGHVAALYVLWGDERADAFFRTLRENGAKLLGGNGPVAEAVGQGQFEMGLTDNDDVAAAQREGKLTGVLPDQNTFGTLLIPTTVGLVAGSKHEADAKRLIDYLLSSKVERKLIDARFAYGSVRVGPPSFVNEMKVDYATVAKKMPDAVRRATVILDGRE